MLALGLFPTPIPVTIHVRTDVALRTFQSDEAFGAGVDGHELGDNETIYTRHNVAAMRAAGLRPLTYRLRTELGCEAWHWNPVGKWSDPSKGQGYWTSSDKPEAPIKLSYGYRLPRRGNTLDQANNDGYSRIDDGDPATFWKSNPYLDPSYAGDPEDRFPQWVVLDLGSPAPVDDIRIHWANPYAVKFRVEYWNGPNPVSGRISAKGEWVPVANGLVDGGRGGVQTVKLGSRLQQRFIRLDLLRSSHTSEPSKYPDPRDRMGFAIREIEMGTMEHGRLIDKISHRRDNRQTAIYTSSTDPWHRVSDRDPMVEQPGLDLVYRSGLANGLPMLVPVSVLYDAPENAEAEIRWLTARGYPIAGIEMGEEPDGQYATPEHYAALYARLARKLHQIAPKAPTGGPSFQSTDLQFAAWPDGGRSRRWLRRFLNYLHENHESSLFQFFSFEWYPFDDPVDPATAQLRTVPARLGKQILLLRQDGLSSSIPQFITEYGYSAFASQLEVEPAAAILNLETVAAFLKEGGARAYLYGYEPGTPITERRHPWGNLMMLEADDDGQARWKLPTFWAAWLMTHKWTLPGHQIQRLLPCSPSSDAVQSYAVRRSDGRVAVLLLNPSSDRSFTATVEIDGKCTSVANLWRYGPDQYLWRANGENGHPIRSKPPLQSRANGPIILRPMSVAVVVY